MQFVVMMDLIGTLVLPVAIILTAVLIISMAKTHITSFVLAVPLILLIIVLFSPALLIFVTTKKWIYVAWMGVYLLALPIWNFVLPVYSFWHFDDFSWGETRKVTGEGKGDDHGKKDGVFDPSTVPMKRWEEHERARIRAYKRQERKRRNQQQNRPPLPSNFAHSVVPGEDESRVHLLDNASDMSLEASDSLGSPMNYFDPSKEGSGKAGGYYPSYRPTQDRNLSPPAASAPGPWGPTSYSSPMSSPRSPQGMGRPMPPSPGGPPMQQRPLQLQQGFVPQGSPQMRPPGTGPGGYRPPPPRNGSARQF